MLVAMNVPQASFDVWRPFCVYRIYGLAILAHTGEIKIMHCFYFTNCWVAIFFSLFFPAHNVASGTAWIQLLAQER